MADRLVEELDQFERFVLLGVIDLARSGETPARSDTVLSWCRDHETHAPAPSGVTEGALIDALETLEATGLLAAEEVRSPVGKGRPAHALDVGPDTAMDAIVADDDDVGSVVRTIREGE